LPTFSAVSEPVEVFVSEPRHEDPYAANLGRLAPVQVRQLVAMGTVTAEASRADIAIQL
jgi:hypothetical protein